MTSGTSRGSASAESLSIIRVRYDSHRRIWASASRSSRAPFWMTPLVRATSGSTERCGVDVLAEARLHEWRSCGEDRRRRRHHREVAHRRSERAVARRRAEHAAGHRDAEPSLGERLEVVRPANGDRVVGQRRSVTRAVEQHHERHPFLDGERHDSMPLRRVHLTDRAAGNGEVLRRDRDRQRRRSSQSRDDAVCRQLDRPGDRSRRTCPGSNRASIRARTSSLP